MRNITVLAIFHDILANFKIYWRFFTIYWRKSQFIGEFSSFIGEFSFTRHFSLAKSPERGYERIPYGDR